MRGRKLTAKCVIILLISGCLSLASFSSVAQQAIDQASQSAPEKIIQDKQAKQEKQGMGADAK